MLVPDPMIFFYTSAWPGCEGEGNGSGAALLVFTSLETNARHPRGKRGRGRAEIRDSWKLPPPGFALITRDKGSQGGGRLVSDTEASRFLEPFKAVQG